MSRLSRWVFNGGFIDPHAPGIDDIHTVAFAIFGKYYFAGFEFSYYFRIIPHGCVPRRAFKGVLPVYNRAFMKSTALFSKLPRAALFTARLISYILYDYLKLHITKGNGMRDHLCGLIFCGFMIMIAVRADCAEAANFETMKELIKLQFKTDSLEKKVLKQDSTLIEQADILAEQRIKALKHDSDLVDIIGVLHRQYGIPALTDEGFTMGVGATMVLQGTNVPNAGIVREKKGGRRILFNRYNFP